MRKRYLKKAAVIALAGLMMAQTALTGCGKKDVDYNLEEGGKGESGKNSNREGIAGKLGIPKEAELSIDVGNSGLSSITIDCDEIKTPKAESMSVLHFTPAGISDDEKAQLIETFLEKDKGIYLYDYENRPKEDYDEEIEFYNGELKRAKEDGDTDYVTYLTDEIKNLEEKRRTAPDTYPVAKDYEGDNFIGEYQGTEYNFNIYSYSDDTDEDASAGMGINYYWTLHGDGMEMRPYEGADSVYFYSSGDLEEENKGKMTQEEAEALAGEFIAKLGLEDVTLKDCANLKWNYNDKDGNLFAEENDGYVVTYTRGINNTPVYNQYMYNVDYLNQMNGWINWPTESYEMSVYDGKVVSFFASYVCKKADSVDENVTLLSYDEIIEKAKTEIPAYYEKYKTRYKNVEFNEVSLEYFIVSDGDGKCKYIPVWVFAEVEEVVEEYGTEGPKQIVVMNAMDGTVVDLVEEAKNMGCYESWN